MNCAERARCWLQKLSTRARKDVKVEDIKVQVCLYAFDCLFLNGKVIVDRPLTERREALYSAISEKPGELFYATAKVICALTLLLFCVGQGRSGSGWRQGTKGRLALGHLFGSGGMRGSNKLVSCSCLCQT